MVSGRDATALRGASRPPRPRSRPYPLSGPRYGIGLVVLAVAAVATVVLGVSYGAVVIPPSEVWGLIGDHLTGTATISDPVADQIVWELRLPRVLLALVVGAGLAVSGAVLQTLVRNPLADPYVLGSAEGASTGAVLVIVLGSGAIGGLGVSSAAFIGAVVSLTLVFLLARGRRGYTATRLVLTGVAVGYLFSAATGIIQLTADPRELRSVVFWLLGSVAGAQWSDLGIPSLAVVVATLWLALSARTLNALSVGEESAATLGVDVRRLRIELMVVSSILVGTAVAVAGAIGFVGLLIPHAVRMLTGPDHRRVIPMCALAGAVFLGLVDLVARVVVAPSELPLGIFTAALGAPFFLWVMHRTGRRSEVE